MDLLQLQVTGVIRETKDTVTILLEALDNKKITYQAGQFLTFIFKNGDNEIRRSYSFSSTPDIDRTAAVTVKRIANGEISRFLAGHIQRGDRLFSLQPSGMFTIETKAALSRQIFFITAGSGITPVFSLLKKVLREEPLTKIFLIYQNRDESKIIFKKQLQVLEKKFPAQLRWINLLSKPKKNHHVSHRLVNDLLEKLVMEYFSPKKEALFYLCGPPALMRMAQFTLRVLGFSDNQIRRENFTVAQAPTPPPVADTDPKTIVIHYQKQTHTITAAYPTNILQAALNNHIQLPYSCRAGACSTCVARLLKGRVKMSMNEVLTEKDLQQGLVLTCVGYAETDVELAF